MVTADTLAGALPTCPSIWRAKVVRSMSWLMPAKRAGALVSSWPMSGVLLLSMAATYFVCMSSNVKYSTVTLAPFFCAQRWALASMALLVGSTYVFRIQRRMLVPFFTAGAAGRGNVSRAVLPTAPARSERRLMR
jgi:hypothetical protein